MLNRCLPAAVLAALCLPAQASADSVSITVHRIQAGPTASLPSVVFRSGGVITLPTGNDVVAITIGGMNVGGLTSRGHNPRELTVQGLEPKWDTGTVKDSHLLDRGRGRAGQPVDTGVGEDFASSGNDASGEGTSGSGEGSSGQTAALDRTVIFAGGAGEISGLATTGAAALLLSGVGEGSRTPPAFGLLGTGEGSLLALSESQPIANPEPTSMLLLGTGLAGLAAIRRRRSGRNG
jgi:hypothetical protein